MTGTISFPLRQSKLQRPRLLRNIVTRPQLWSMLDRGIEKPLTLVCAGPGFGKTTLVCSWLARRDAASPAGLPLHTAWLSLDEHDGDLKVFLNYCIAALRTVVDAACTDTLALLQSQRAPRTLLLYTTFVNDLVQLPHDVVLVLDDFSAVPGLAATELLNEMLRTWPPRLHLVMLTRRNPALPLPAMRARDQLIEVRSQQLRFSRAEIVDYLSRTIEGTLNEAEIGLIEQQSEGWVTGIKLAALAWRGDDSGVQARSQWMANAATITEYLSAEVFARQPPAIQRFLLCTSVLDHFNASLCAAILGEEETGWSAADCITWLVQGDLFTVALDSSHEWYRYHHLFRDNLRRRLADTAGAGEITELHRRAANWFVQHGRVDEALYSALQANDLDLVCRLIDHEIPYVLNREDRATLDRWLNLLEPALVEQRPELLLLKAWVLQFKWQVGAQLRVIDQIDALRGTADRPPAPEHSPDSVAGSLPVSLPDTMQSELDLLRGQAAFYTNQPQQAIALLRPVLAQYPADWTYMRGGAALYLGLSMQASGDFASAERWLLDQFEHYRDKRDGFSLRLCMCLCFCYLAEGNLEKAWQTAGDMLHNSQDRNLPTQASWAYYFLGLVCHYRNELDCAEQHFAALLQHQYAATSVVIYNGLAHLALIRQLRGRREEAWQVIEILKDVDLDGGGRVTDATHAMSAWLDLLQGDVEAALRWAHSFTAPAPDAPLLWLANPHLIQARILLASQEKADLLAACRNLEALAVVAGRTYNRRYMIEILAIRAVAYHRLHNSEAALAALRDSLDLAAGLGLERIYTGLGPDMAEMLQVLRSQGTDVERLLALFAEARPSVVAPVTLPRDGSTGGPPVASATPANGGGAAPAAPLRSPVPASGANRADGADGTVEPLTMREIEVLALLREPLSMKEIARKLVVADSTVKRHTINIYGKLGVNRRWDAVAKAEALGYLPQR